MGAVQNLSDRSAGLRHGALVFYLHPSPSFGTGLFFRKSCGKNAAEIDSGAMSGQTAEQRREYLTVDAYLEGERHSEVRHEYFDGEVFAMAGASQEHELVALNLAAALHSHLKGKPCRAFKDGMKLRLQAMGRDLFYYPDI